MKKILRFCRNWILIVLWTIIFFQLANFLTILTWRFNILSERSWQILAEFWDQGGVLKTPSDVTLLFTLIFLPVFWLLGLRYCIKQNYAVLFVKLISGIFSIFSRHPNLEPEHIVLKNVKTSQQAIEDIKNELESLKPDKSEEAGSIRTNINKKLSNSGSAPEN